jgi:hypothetical protein
MVHGTYLSVVPGGLPHRPLQSLTPEGQVYGRTGRAGPGDRRAKMTALRAEAVANAAGGVPAYIRTVQVQLAAFWAAVLLVSLAAVLRHRLVVCVAFLLLIVAARWLSDAVRRERRSAAPATSGQRMVVAVALVVAGVAAFILGRVLLAVALVVPALATFVSELRVWSPPRRPWVAGGLLFIAVVLLGVPAPPPPALAWCGWPWLGCCSARSAPRSSPSTPRRRRRPLTRRTVVVLLGGGAALVAVGWLTMVVRPGNMEASHFLVLLVVVALAVAGASAESDSLVLVLVAAALAWFRDNYPLVSPQPDRTATTERPSTPGRPEPGRQAARPVWSGRGEEGP